MLERSKLRSSACAVSSSSRPPASSIAVKALMSAPAENSSGFDEAMTSARTPEPSTFSHTAPQVGDHLRGDRVHQAVGQPRDGDVAARLELDRLARLLVVGLRVGVEALAALLAQAALGDEPAQHERRGEALAVALGGALQALEDHVEALHVGLHEGREEAAARVQAGAGHHADVDVAVGGHALLEHEAGLDEGLQRQQLDELVDVGLGVALEVGLALRASRGRRRRSWRRACPRPRGAASPSGT